MKIKNLYVIILILIGTIVLFQTWDERTTHASAKTSGAPVSQGAPTLALLSADAQHIDLQADLTGLSSEDIIINGQRYTRLSGEGYGFPEQTGLPELPVLRRYVEIPLNATYSLEMLNHTYIDASLQELGFSSVYPFQPPAVKLENSNAIPDFTIDEGFYATGEMYPVSVVTLGEEFVLRGHRILTVEIWPAAYDPSAGTLRTTSQVTFRLNLQGSDLALTQSTAERYASPGFDTRLADQVLNYNQGQPVYTNAPVGYLIISADAYYDAIQPFADLKESRNFDVTVTKTSEIPGGATTTNIRTYILNAYTNWPIPPSYVLFVGDTDTIPTWTGPEIGTSTDLYYGGMDGDFDWHPDIGRGRFPARSAAQVTAMVDKYLTYSTLTGEEEWLQKAAFPTTCDNYSVGEGTQNYVINSYTAPAGKFGNFPVNPTPGGDKLYCVTNSATHQDLIDSFNDGRWAIIYTGHGSYGGWEMDFTPSDVSNLTNAGMYPFVASHACLSGDFGQVEVYGETWVLEENKGALVYWGSSTYSYWDEDDVLERRMFDSLFAEALGYVDVATMTDDGLAGVELAYPSSARYYWETYNVLGDPAVKLFMEPDLPTFTLDVTPDSHSVCAVEVVTSTVEIGSVLGYSETVYLDTGPLPGDVLINFEPPQAPAPYDSTMLMYVYAPIGDYTITISATDQISYSQDASLNLRVVDALPNTPDLLTPPDGAMDQPFKPSFTWEALDLVDSYNFQLAATPLFDQPLFEANSLAQPTYTLPDSLDGGVCYWWRAQANNACGVGEWQEPFHFATVALEAVFDDDIESGDSLWQHTATQGSDNWEISTQQSHSPSNAWYVPDDGTITDSRLWNELAVDIAPGAVLTFWHQYQFEGESYDGSVLEISTDDGTTWQDLGEHIIANGYTGVVDSGYSNPLAGRHAWTGDLTEWTQVSVDLNDFAGESALIRWRIGCDSGVSDTGWFIDDVSITAPMPTNPAPVIIDMQPEHGSPYTPTAVEITGSDFMGQPAARLGDTWLLSVTLVNSTTIEAVVPAGMPNGYYDLTLYNGDCQEAELPDAFLIAEHEPPVVIDDAAETAEETSVLIDVLANDYDPEGNDLILTRAGTPLHGQTYIIGTQILYIPTVDYFGADTFTYTASDGDLQVDGTVTIAVTPINDAPVLNPEDLSITPQGIQENETLTLTATFQDADPQDTHQTMVEWGDGFSETIGLVEGVTTFALAHQYLDNPPGGSSYTVNVSVADVETSASAAVEAMVENVPPVLPELENLTISVGKQLAVNVAFSDPGLLDTHTVTVVWSDGLTETIDLEAGVLVFDLEHTFAQPGSYTVELQLIDDDGAVATASFTVSVPSYLTRLPLIVRH